MSPKYGRTILEFFLCCKWKNKMIIYQCPGLQPGQYSFPFCFKTFEGWPASFDHITPRKKGAIIYHMVVEIESPNRQLQLKHAQEITLR